MCSFKFVVNNISVLRCRSVEVKASLTENRCRARKLQSYVRIWAEQIRFASPISLWGDFEETQGSFLPFQLCAELLFRSFNAVFAPVFAPVFAQQAQYGILIC